MHFLSSCWMPGALTGLHWPHGNPLIPALTPASSVGISLIAQYYKPG